IKSFSQFLDALAKQPDLTAEALKKAAEAAEALKKVPDAQKNDPKLLDDALANLDKKAGIVVFLAESYSSMEKHAQAAELLERIPSTVKYHTAVQVLHVRELRLGKQFDKATQLLNDLLGSKEKPGPAHKNLDARKERILLLEDQGKYGTRTGAVLSWNTFMKELRPLVEKDNKVREMYYDAYYHWVHCIFKFAVKENKP